VGDPERSLTKDEMLDDISIYWFTNTGASGARLYWEYKGTIFRAADVSIPAALSLFSGEVHRPSRSWAEQAYHDLIYFNEVDKGGHFGLGAARALRRGGVCRIQVAALIIARRPSCL
jgi:hypothetical protein